MATEVRRWDWLAFDLCMVSDREVILVFVALGACAFLSAFLTLNVRRYALAHSILDIPNERSSHVQPVPRGGGLAVVVSVFVGLIALRWFGRLSTSDLLSLAVGGGMVAIVGWVDDRKAVSPLVRLCVHFAAAIIGIVFVGGLNTIHVGTRIWSIGTGGNLLAVIAIVWSINLYNFMDGIDGLAAANAVTVAAAAGVLSLLLGNANVSYLAFLVAAACAGFLPWNWSPARIFLGDIGSGFLGYVFAVLALISEQNRALPITGWALLLAVFLVDSTFTLVARLFRGERLHVAHRSHAYQSLVRRGWAHSSVVLGVCVVNAVLAGAATLTVTAPSAAPIIMVVAAGLVGALYWLIKRGEGRRAAAASNAPRAS